MIGLGSAGLLVGVAVRLLEHRAKLIEDLAVQSSGMGWWPLSLRISARLRPRTYSISM